MADRFEQGLDFALVGLRAKTGNFLTVLEHDEGRAVPHIQLIHNGIVLLTIPVHPHQLYYPVFRLVVEQRTHGAFLRAAAASPASVEIKQQRLTSRHRLVIRSTGILFKFCVTCANPATRQCESC